MRNMSFAMTTDAVIARTKTVTRRTGWKFLKRGDLIRPMRKTMGLKKGEKIEPLLDESPLCAGRCCLVLETCQVSARRKGFQIGQPTSLSTCFVSITGVTIAPFSLG